MHTLGEQLGTNLLVHMLPKAQHKPSRMPPLSASSYPLSHTEIRFLSLSRPTRNLENSEQKQCSSRVLKTVSHCIFLTARSNRRETNNFVRLPRPDPTLTDGRIVKLSDICGAGMRRRLRWKHGMVCKVMLNILSSTLSFV